MKRSSLSLFIMYFSRAYFSKVEGLVFNSSSSCLVSLICLSMAFSLCCNVVNSLTLFHCVGRSFRSIKHIQVINPTAVIRYLFWCHFGIRDKVEGVCGRVFSGVFCNGVMLFQVEDIN